MVLEVFFYGLFMDQAILRKNGIESGNPRIGFVDDFVLKIGNRASLIPSNGDRAYGLVIEIEEEALDTLYSEPSVSDYISEEVTVILDLETTTRARCYNLSANLLIGTNKAYAKQLHLLAEELGLPDSYLEEIATFFH